MCISPVAEITGYDTKGILPRKVRGQEISERLFLLLVDCTD